ncbi:hypothetical protein N0V95_008695 [Ascochyta clinopodiicola]|nr:hypothetical protein N0V95_008695 [Ascochyta clinopodiicola]
MLLLDLPPELFGLVIAHLVNDSGISEAWQHRRVCRTFRRSIEFETLANQPIRAFLRANETSACSILKNNAALYLSYRVKALKGAYSFIPLFMKMICDTTTVGLAEGNYQTRKQYERDLCRLLFKETTTAKILLTIKSPARSTKYSYCVSLFDKDLFSNQIAAAAAVGDLQALRTALYNDPRRIWDKSPAFGYPLAATAAAGGHHKIVCAIVKHFEQTQEQIHMFDIRIQFSDAVHAGFEAGDVHTVLLLLRIFTEYGAPLTEDRLQLWTSKAVSMGNSKVIRQVLKLRQLYTMESAFESACLSENIKAVREFIKKRLLPLHCSYSYATHQTPIYIATLFGSPKIVEKLIKSGSNPNGYFVRSNDCHPLWIAIQKNEEGIVRVLLRHGADPELVLPLWDETHGRFKNKRATIGVLLRKARRQKNYYVPPTISRTQFAADAADLTIPKEKTEEISDQVE